MPSHDWPEPLIWPEDLPLIRELLSDDGVEELVPTLVRVLPDGPPVVWRKVIAELEQRLKRRHTGVRIVLKSPPRLARSESTVHHFVGPPWRLCPCHAGPLTRRRPFYRRSAPCLGPTPTAAPL